MRIVFVSALVSVLAPSTEAFSTHKPVALGLQTSQRKSIVSFRETPSPVVEKEIEQIDGATTTIATVSEPVNNTVVEKQEEKQAAKQEEKQAAKQEEKQAAKQEEKQAAKQEEKQAAKQEEKEEPAKEFVNDGPLAWMQQYLDMFGVEEGKSVYYGPIAVEVDASKRVSDDEARRRRQQALQELSNIGPEERERRNQAGTVMTVLSAVYVSWAALFADDGGFVGHFLRFLSVFPIFLAVGYKVSAKTGLCNIAQSGMWDVDGNGLSKIEDPTVARTILTRVNNMNFENLVKVAVPVTIFAALPQSASSSLVGFALLFAALYALQGKVPQN